jgi:hypothetical protein
MTPSQLEAARETVAAAVTTSLDDGEHEELRDALRTLLLATAPPSEEELHQEAAQFANAQTGSLPGRNDAASMAKADKRQWDRAGEDPWLLIGRDYIAGARREGAR